MIDLDGWDLLQLPEGSGKCRVLFTRFCVSAFGTIAKIFADTGSIRLVGILLFGNTVRTRRPLESVTVVPGSYIAFSRMTAREVGA